MTKKEFCKLCDNHEEKIEESISNMSFKQRMKMCAEIKQKIANDDKYSIIIFMCSFLGTLVAIDKSGVMVGFGIIFFIVCVMLCCLIMYNKSRYVKALSYLNDFERYLEQYTVGLKDLLDNK